MVQLILYLAGLIISATEEEHGLNPEMFLGLHPETMDGLGIRMPFKIVINFAVWRLLASLYVTHSFLTVVINTIMQLILGFILEEIMGSFFRMAFFYLLTGVCANIFATAC